MNMINNAELLSRLEFTEKEKAEVITYMNHMVIGLDRLKEVDTEHVEPTYHIFSVNHVLREDIITNFNDRENMLLNAPDEKDGSFRVPRTID